MIENYKEILSNNIELKNYKTLCEILNEKIKTGNGKLAQIKEWNRYFKHHKEGNKIIIDLVYDEPLEKEDDRKINNIILNINKGKYSKEVFPLVKSFVGKNEFEFCSKGKIMKYLKLKNENYDIAYLYPKELARFLKDKTDIDFNESDINTISSAIYEHSNDKINKAFENLQKLNYISEYSNKYIMIYDSMANKSSVATEYQTEIINKCLSVAKREILRNCMGIKDFIEIMKYFREFNYTEDEIESELNIQIFLRGQSKNLKELTLETIYLEGLSNINNYYYAYGYIKNREINWKNEVLDITKEKIHLSNYKNEVRESFLLDKFLEKLDEESKTIYNKEARKINIRNNMKKHKNTYVKKVEYLFDLLIGTRPQFIITEDEMIQIGVVMREERNKIKEQEKEVIPF
jgi:hypothetical protein